MKPRLLVRGLAFSLGLNLVLLCMVAYQYTHEAWPAHRASATPRSPLTHTLLFDEKRLDLTPAQQERFQEIRTRWLRKEQNAKAAGVARIRKLSALLVREDVTTATLKPVFKEIREHSNDFFVRLTVVLQEYRAVLNPEQRVTFNSMLQDRFDALQRFTRQKYFDYERQVNLTLKNTRQGVKKPAVRKSETKVERPVRNARPSPANPKVVPEKSKPGTSPQASPLP